MRPRAGIVGIALIMTAPTACTSPERAGPPIKGEVFMEVTATRDEVAAVRAALKKTRSARSIRFIDHDDAYRIATELFKKDQNLLDSISPADLPASFRYTSRSRPDALKVRKRVGRLAGVEEVKVSPPKISAEDIKEARAIWEFGARCGRSTLPPADASAFMEIDAGLSEVQFVNRKLLSTPDVTGVVHVTRERALREFRATIGRDRPEPLHGRTAADFPESFGVRLEHPNRPQAFVRAIRDLPGVDAVVLNECPRL